MDCKGIPDRLALVLESQKSVSAFARKCGLPESGVRAYLSGRSVPGVDKLLAMAQAAGVRFEWLAIGNRPMRESDATEQLGEGRAQKAAQYLYAAGYEIDRISEILGVEPQRVKEWKDSSATPGYAPDQWEELRQREQPYSKRLRRVLERQVAYLEKTKPQDLSVEVLQTIEKTRWAMEALEAADLSHTYQIKDIFDELRSIPPDEREKILSEAKRVIRDHINKFKKSTDEGSVISELESKLEDSTPKDLLDIIRGVTFIPRPGIPNETMTRMVSCLYRAIESGELENDDVARALMASATLNRLLGNKEKAEMEEKRAAEIDPSQTPWR